MRMMIVIMQYLRLIQWMAPLKNLLNFDSRVTENKEMILLVEDYISGLIVNKDPNQTAGTSHWKWSKHLN